MRGAHRGRNGGGCWLGDVGYGHLTLTVGSATVSFIKRVEDDEEDLFLPGGAGMRSRRRTRPWWIYGRLCAGGCDGTDFLPQRVPRARRGERREYPMSNTECPMSERLKYSDHSKCILCNHFRQTESRIWPLAAILGGGAFSVVGGVLQTTRLQRRANDGLLAMAAKIALSGYEKGVRNIDD